MRAGRKFLSFGEFLVPTFTFEHDPVYSGRNLPTFREDAGTPNFYSKGEASGYLRKVTMFLLGYTALHRGR